MILILGVVIAFLVGDSISYVEQCALNTNCTEVYPLNQTKKFACNASSQCPDGYLCCQDCQFRHSVCKKSVKVNKKVPEKEIFTESYCPRQKLCQYGMVPIKKSEYLKCEKDSSCPFGYFCCFKECIEHRVCLRGNDFKDESCPKDKITCAIPYEEEYTLSFRCQSDAECPEGHQCCKDSCFTHRVCKKTSWEPKVDDNFCPKDSVNCKEPLPIEITKEYECNEDRRCRNGYVCCKDNCYQHKVCKNPRTEDTKCPIVLSNTCALPLPYNQTKKYECNNSNRICVNGFICCNDPCYQHPICKDPSSETSKNLRCPVVTSQCTRIHLLDFGVKPNCRSDQECREDEACCPDECTSSKICKPVDTSSSNETYPENVVVHLPTENSDNKEVGKNTTVDLPTSTEIYDDLLPATANDTKEEEEDLSGASNENGSNENPDDEFTLSMEYYDDLLPVTDDDTKEEHNESEEDDNDENSGWLEYTPVTEELDDRSHSGDYDLVFEESTQSKNSIVPPKKEQEDEKPEDNDRNEQTDVYIKNGCPKLEEDCKNLPEILPGKTVCESDEHCKVTELCCPFKCIRGIKICKVNMNIISAKCPAVGTCDQRQFSLSGKAICNADFQCEADELCCEDSCIFQYKICKKIILEFANTTTKE